MAEQQPALPCVSQQTPAVDFVDRCLAEVHPAFQNSQAMTRYDPASDQYVPLSTGTVGSATMPPPGDPRPLPPAVAAMRFWDQLFPQAMSQFTSKHEEPKAKRRILDDHSYLIREKPNWAEVYDELQAAKTVYDGKGSMRHVKKGLRVVFDKVKLVQPATAVLPSVEYLSPVLGALQIIMDVSGRSQPEASHRSDSSP